MLAVVGAWISAKLFSFFSRFGLYLVAAISVVASILGLLFYVKHTGRLAERMAGLTNSIKVARGKRDLDRKIDALDDAARLELLRSQRDRIRR